MHLLLDLKVKVVARALCTSINTGVTYTFSNANIQVPSEQYSYGLSLRTILGTAIDPKNGKKIDKCTRSNMTNFRYNHHSALTKNLPFGAYKKNTLEARKNGGPDCCATACPYIGLAYGLGADLSLVYNWACNLDKYSSPSNDRYTCARDTLKFNATIISSTSMIAKSIVVETPSLIENHENNGRSLPCHNVSTCPLVRRVRQFYAFRLRFSGAGQCTENVPFSFQKVFSQINTIVLNSTHCNSTTFWQKGTAIWQKNTAITSYHVVHYKNKIINT